MDWNEMMSTLSCQWEDLKMEAARMAPIVLAFSLGVLVTILFFLPEIIGVKCLDGDSKQSERFTESPPVDLPHRMHLRCKP